MLPYFTDPKTDRSPQAEEENETPYNATLQILITHLGQAILKLDFDQQTVETLTKEISCNVGEEALLKFVIEARNTKTSGTYSMVFKGAVAPTHCMPLSLNLQGGEYMFGVEVHKLCKETKQFSSFMKRVVILAPTILYYEPQILASNEVQSAHDKHNPWGPTIRRLSHKQWSCL